MNRATLTKILESYRHGKTNLAAALEELKDFPAAKLGNFAQLDLHRELRTGHPEVIYCAGKTPQQVRSILERLLAGKGAILATRANAEHWDAAKSLSPTLAYDPISRTIIRRGKTASKNSKKYIAVVAAGTSDLPVAEEAAITAEVFGNRVERVFDVGVAGLHRLMNRLDVIRNARCIVAVAGMEGALPSVLGGLVDKPIIAVPTSIGYGANFGGLSALLAMLNSCAPGISVVNIDNGFGAGTAASTINRL
ncbi:MAG: nickel pincer cofactor biosynthesis protein LarB [Verrucomicrobia bacterium]|nr:nickel pincer cofactor biosynthesis protein LarB [Verrucomicrobiota bacterium]